LKIKWVRGNDYISFKRPNVWFVQGVRGSGKSSFLEHLANIHLKLGNSILDLFGSRDGEGLAWLRSPWAEEKRILLLRGSNVLVDCSYDVKTVGEVSLKDFEKYDIIISASPLYSSMDQEFLEVARLTDKIYKRVHWRRMMFVIMREAANFLYSRLKLLDDQTEAKAQTVYMLREGRHCGISFGLDSVRLLSIDVDIRGLSDYLILKAQGIHGLSRELKWLYRYFNPHELRKLKPHQFVIVTRRGSVGWGVFKKIPWHKKEKEDILKAVDIKVEYLEEPEKGVNRGKYKTVGDEEHAEIIRLKIEENLGIHVIADKLGRSPRTIHTHIRDHDHYIESLGLCPRCKRAGSIYAIRKTTDREEEPPLVIPPPRVKNKT